MPSLPDLSIRQLEYLVAVADTDSFAEAAGLVGVSASALSQGLAELERRVGVELFDRDGRRRVLRPAAVPVLDHARQVVALTGDLIRWSQAMNRAVAGALRVGMIDVAALHHYSSLVSTFRAERADVEFSLTVAPSGSLLDGVRRGDLDVVVCTAPSVAPAGLSVEPLLAEAMLVVAPGRVGKPATWGPWVTFPEGSHSRARILEALRDRGAPLTIAAESHQPDVLLEMVRMGLGWTVLPAEQLADDPAGVEIGPRLFDRQLVIARRTGAVTDPVADAFVRGARDAHHQIT